MHHRDVPRWCAGTAHSSTVALTMKLLMILVSVLLPATVEAQHIFMSKSNLSTAIDEYDTSPTVAEVTYGPIAGWDVSRITDMSSLFENKANFNADISGWDTSSVTDMSNMFFSAAAFNQPLSFDTSSVTDMASMFHWASAFNQSLTFDTARVTSMHAMFFYAVAFNQPLSLDTSSVTSMAKMFDSAAAFNQPLTFDTSSIASMSDMFKVRLALCPERPRPLDGPALRAPSPPLYTPHVSRPVHRP